MMNHRTNGISGELPDGAEVRAMAAELRDLYDEISDYLDDDQIERFPTYFIEECMYQVVSRENFVQGLPQAAIYCDGIGMVRDRITALRESQVYVPRTWRHFVSGVRVTALLGDEVHARANFMVTEAMSDAEPTILLIGQYVDVLVRRGERLRFKQRLAVYDNYRVTRALVIPV
jgi:anthranilate 1,2-dioxygenase small subunit